MVIPTVYHSSEFQIN